MSEGGIKTLWFSADMLKKLNANLKTGFYQKRWQGTFICITHFQQGNSVFYIIKGSNTIKVAVKA